jgi:lysophospholipase L1-like esterase
VLGDSFTVGTNVSQEEAYPEVLETLLNAHGNTPVEVVNAGVGGWSPLQYAEYYEHYGQDFTPDLVLVGFFVGNDTYDTPSSPDQLDTAVLGRRVTQEAANSRAIDLKIFLYEHFNIARMIMNIGRPTQEEFSRKDCGDFTEQYLNIQRYRLFHNHGPRSASQEAKVQNSIDQIVRIQQLAARHGASVVVALIPDENQINTSLQRALTSEKELAKLDFEMPQAMINDKLTQAGIPVIDLLPTIRRDPRCLFMNDTHLTTEGHALVASTIYESIKSDVDLQ